MLGRVKHAPSCYATSASCPADDQAAIQSPLCRPPLSVMVSTLGINYTQHATSSAAPSMQVINSIQNAPAAERPGGLLAYLSMAYAASFMCNNALEAAQVGFVIYSIVSPPGLPALS